MKRICIAATALVFILASCGGSQQNGESSEGMGDSLEQEMTPTDTSGMPVPVDTAVDTSMVDTAAMP